MKKQKKDKKNLCKCGDKGMVLHSCPYASDIDGNDDEEYCNCCTGCIEDCAQDI